MTLSNSGAGLEARLQRLFIAQGVHAERGLFVRAGRRENHMATDIDMLAVSYAPNFHRSVFHAECKGEKEAKTLGRVFWLAGVRKYLQADRSLLVVPSFDVENNEFARDLNIEILNISTLEELERAYQIGETWWPGRSNYLRWDSLQITRDRYELMNWLPDPVSEQLKSIYSLCYEEGWREMSYGFLNRLLRQLTTLGEVSGLANDKAEVLNLLRLATSYALVRLSHYMLGICQDLLSWPPLERSAYLADRLTFAERDAYYMRRLVERSMKMAKAVLAEHNLELPERWNIEHLLQVPKYQPAVIEVVERLLEHPEQSIYLPFAMELIQFGYEPEPRGAVQGWVDAGRRPVELLKALLVQQFSIPNALLEAPDSAVLNGIPRPVAEKHAHGQRNKQTAQGSAKPGMENEILGTKK